MKSYILAVAVAMLLSAVYAFQNAVEITVQFLMFSRKFPQGVWEVIVFSAGAFLMWFFSVIASVEIHTKHTKQLKERDKRIAELEGEKRSLLTAFNHIAPGTDPLAKPEPAEEAVTVEAAPPTAVEVEHMSEGPAQSDLDADDSDFIVTEASTVEKEEEPAEGDDEKESSFV